MQSVNTNLARGTWHMEQRSLLTLPGVAYVLPLLLIVFAVSVPGFASAPNLLNIGIQSSILLLLALPMTFVIMSEGIDLSMGALLGLCSVVLALLLARDHALGTAVIVAVAIGLAAGLVNGALVVLAGIPPFVVTLGTLGIAQGLALVITDGASIVGLGTALPALYGQRWLGLPFPIVAAVGAYAAFHVLMYHTRYGPYVFAIGGNRESLVLAGISAGGYHVSIYALAGAMVGAAALLFTARMSAGHPVAGIGLEFDAIAAVVLGGTERGRGWLPGTLLGVVAVGVLKNGLNLLAVPSSLQVAGVGLLVIAVLVVDAVRGRR
jgi:ribose transport system permease protein